jgi:hypothetical protein
VGFAVAVAPHMAAVAVAVLVVPVEIDRLLIRVAPEELVLRLLLLVQQHLIRETSGAVVTEPQVGEQTLSEVDLLVVTQHQTQVEVVVVVTQGHHQVQAAPAS